MRRKKFINQLSLFGESNDQNFYSSEEWGMLTFYEVKEWSEYNCCRRCLLHGSSECWQAPCQSWKRNDKRHGYYSIHEMPDMT